MPKLIHRILRANSFRKLSRIGYMTTVAAMIAAQPAFADLIETFEAAKVTSSTAKNTTVVDFNKIAPGTYTLKNNPSVTTVHVDDGSKEGLTATYSNLWIKSANQYGGAPDPTDASKGTNYFAVNHDSSVTMSLSKDEAYFGLWYSAADPFNSLSFYHDDTLIKVNGLTSVSGPSLSYLSKDYNGNPTSEFKGQDGSEKFVFINFYAKTDADKFNKIVFSNGKNNGTIFESDNHTFSVDIQETTGTPVPSPVPEPSSFALLGLGAAALGASALRRRRQTV